MYPNAISEDTESEAERRLYHAFARDLPDDWVAFHSARWLARDTRRGAQDGETDFVIVAPEHGILVMEVKGGVIQYDGPTAKWLSNEHPIKDPFQQATKSKFNLIRKMREMPIWHRKAPRINHVVAFPDVRVEADLRPDAPQAIILGAQSLSDLRGWFECAFSYYGMHGQLSSNDVEALVDLLAPSRELHLRLADAISRDEHRIIELTEEQYAVLDLLRLQRRFAVFGCAGTGKTMLAIEQARRLSRQGFRVLLTCFNGPLVGYITETGDLPDSVTVSNYHRLCREVGQEAGLEVREPENPSTDWYQTQLPEILWDAADRLGGLYDAVIVDEAQDFRANYWEPLLLLLLDPDQGPLYVFYDDNQNLYEADPQVPAGLPRYPLTRNMRNTQRIHRAFAPFYIPRDGTEPIAGGPEGSPIEVHYYATEHELRRRLGQVLHRLTRVERVPVQDIVILAPHSSRGLVHECPRIGNYQLVTRDHPEPGQVQCTTIHRYKGLEKPVVILAGLQPDSKQNLETLFYVGASRARHYLVVLASTDIPDRLRSQLVSVGVPGSTAASDSRAPSKSRRGDDA
jgi:hypothetical protein